MFITGNTTWRISVQLSAPLEYTLEEAKQLLIDCMDNPSSADNFDFENLEEHQNFIQSIRAATNFASLLKELNISAPEELP